MFMAVQLNNLHLEPPKRPIANRWINKLLYIHIMGYYP